MKRALLDYLRDWLGSKERKPLVVRGARQVGKTWLVRHFAEAAGKQLIELNFEKQPALASLFDGNDPKQILLNLSAVLGQDIDPGQSLLFLDEIQAVPQLFSKLRWFYEDLSALPVVAAGSLLEFVLAEHSFSMPVGRISYLHLEPLSFEEFLLAQNKASLYDYLQSYDLKVAMPLAIHEQLLALFKEYIFVGGLPAAVNSWVLDRSLQKVSQIQQDLLATYRDDFMKYRGRVPVERLDEVMIAVPKMLGQKFVFSRVNSTLQAAGVRQILDLLEKARTCHRVWSSSSNGVPLAAEIKEKYFKAIFLDTGLCSTALGLGFGQINDCSELTLINNGAIAEQVVGQMLRTIEPPYKEPALYCWHRDEVGSSAEIDYVLQHGSRVIPIEVKAGATGSLKSLHLFMGLKQLPLALRINSGLPSTVNVDVKNNTGASVQYQLISIPFYLTGQLHRLLG
jgi:predicted AAA+ superfamily ATPase